MYIEHTEEQKALRQELRSYFRSLMTPELIEATRSNEGGDAYKSVIRQIGQDGWLALGWPKEYGGQGRGPMDQMIFFEEAQFANAPLPFVTINTVAPAIMAHGSEEHKKFFLPKIAAGDLHFAIGYSEPGAGTDLASLKTTAQLEGDTWKINGTKVFTSSAEAADYVWLAARTDLEASRPHAGISIFMVATDQPGFSYSPIHTVGDVRTNVSYYTDVTCPNDMICGSLNQGWRLITSQLNHERVGLAAIGIYAYDIYQQVLQWASDTDASGERAIDKPWVQRALAEAYARLEAMRLMTWRMVWSMEHGEPEVAYASAMKAFSTEGLIEVYRLLMDAVGPASTLHRDSPGAAIRGELEAEYRQCQINTFGGGVVEVMRDLVAAFGLNMRAYSR
ncbi:acyl-CoA dehydrogenase family protein [Parahaliea sp. F7430]|uniref:Acyl-CoA dehydrogenase family protein n=1 Tax=Sediminihaliea albiluteola TaxID=2758564 RepID=A0A7W2TW53_9GAMM|nr:acyl-CoA dehydrogenase family protein [Sediminihaliea albiluteola]MBA6413056.1 acyl-CoA dehydrogenase family protein [Sediminihaliea albiluteola]